MCVCMFRPIHMTSSSNTTATIPVHETVVCHHAVTLVAEDDSTQQITLHVDSAYPIERSVHGTAVMHMGMELRMPLLRVFDVTARAGAGLLAASALAGEVFVDNTDTEPTLYVCVRGCTSRATRTKIGRVATDDVAALLRAARPRWRVTETLKTAQTVKSQVCLPNQHAHIPDRTNRARDDDAAAEGYRLTCGCPYVCAGEYDARTSCMAHEPPYVPPNASYVSEMIATFEKNAYDAIELHFESATSRYEIAVRFAADADGACTPPMASADQLMTLVAYQTIVKLLPALLHCCCVLRVFDGTKVLVVANRHVYNGDTTQWPRSVAWPAGTLGTDIYYNNGTNLVIVMDSTVTADAPTAADGYKRLGCVARATSAHVEQNLPTVFEHMRSTQCLKLVKYVFYNSRTSSTHRNKTQYMSDEIRNPFYKDVREAYNKRNVSWSLK